MRLPLRVSALAGIFCLLSCSAAFASLRANYEVSLTEGDKVYSIRTAQTADPENRITEEVGPFEIEMVAVPSSEQQYSLELSITRTASSPGAISPAYTRSFPGSFGGPLEFSADFGELEASGAIIMYRPSR